VIAGAYSLTRQAIQLGLLPRMSVRKTSGEAGGIYIGRINWFLFVGVLFVALAFRTSSALAHAYGVAVTGTMLVTTCLAFLVVRKAWRWSVPLAAAVIAPFLALDLTFFAANALRIPTGGWAPLMLGAGLCLVMATWVKGAALLAKKTGGESMRVGDLLAALNPETVYRAPGTAVFLSSDPDRVPLALMHNLKHNKVLHERNAILTVRTLDSPYAPEAERLTLSWIAPDFARVVLNYGYMETPNVPKALGACRKQGLKFDIVSTSFFLSRRSIVRASRSEMPAWQDKLFLFLAKNATDPTTYFHIPPGRAVEMGAQIAV
jgi:KUP system potassium uptake protein